MSGLVEDRLSGMESSGGEGEKSVGRDIVT